MRHLRKGRKLKRTSSHRRALLRSLAMQLFEHKRISTTEAKAKELRPFAEKLITKAKHAMHREKQGQLAEGQKIDIHNRRIVAKDIRRKAVLQELFDTIAPMVEEREGGYTRIIKTGFRRGDGADTAIIELVDWSAPQDGAVRSKRKRTQPPKKVKVKPQEEEEEIIEEEEMEEELEETDEEISSEEETEEAVESESESETEIDEAPEETAEAEPQDIEEEETEITSPEQTIEEPAAETSQEEKKDEPEASTPVEGEEVSKKNEEPSDEETKAEEENKEEEDKKKD